MTASTGKLRRPRFTHCASYPAIPQKVTSHIGLEVDLTSRKSWKTFQNSDKRGYVTFPVAHLLTPHVPDLKLGSDGRIPRRRSLYGDTLIHVMLLYTVEVIRTRMPNGARNILIGFIHFEKYLAEIYKWGAGNYHFYASHLNHEILDSYARWIADNCPANDKYIGYVRDLYAFGIEQGFAGYERRKLAQLKTVRTKSKFSRNVALFQDPMKGAFDFAEQRQLLAAFDGGVGAPTDRATAALFHQTGIRTVAAVRIRYKHLRKAPAGDSYLLDVPRSKQRRESNAVRTHVIEKWLGDLFLGLRPEGDTGNAFLIHWVRNNRPLKDIRACLTRWAADAGLVTLRIEGENPAPLHLAPYRFRRTIASNLAANGASPWTIANVLDDETLAMAAVYTNNASTIVDILTDTLDKHPTWFRLIRAFLGTLESADDKRLPVVLGGVPYLKSYRARSNAIGELGRCGLGGQCHLLPPLSCYQCPFFRAILDIRAHEMQLEQIKDEINMSIGHESDAVTSVLVDDVVAILGAIAAISEAIGAGNKKNRPAIAASKAIAGAKTRSVSRSTGTVK